MANAASAIKAKKNARRKARGREQARPSRSAATTAIPVAMRRAIPPGGRSLPGDVRSLMESRFNADFSRVTVHEGPPAQGYAASRDANAYALGEHIVFDQGRYAPHGAQGQRLLAHELAHVVQQRRGGAMPLPAVAPVLEAQADRAADAVADAAAAGSGAQVGGASAAGVMCDRTGRKKKRNGVDYDDEQFDEDDDTEQARRKSEKQRTQQEKRDRRTAGQSHAQIGSDEAERDLRRMEDHARKPGGNQRSQKRRDRKLKRFERKLESARGSQLDKNKRKGDFDERQRTPSSVGVTPQTDFVAGSKVLPGQQVRDEDDNSIAHHTRPDFSVIKRRKDGTWERVHFNLKSNQIDRMTESEARAAAREILYQAVKNKAHLPGEERLIISFAHAPSKELQEAIKEELFREHTPISEIRFGNVVHRNADYKPEKGRLPLDVDAKARRRRLAAEAKRAKAKKAADARAAKRKKAADAKAAKAKKAAEAKAAKQKKAADAKAAKQKKAADAKAAKAKKAAEAKAAKAKKAAEAKAAKKQAADAKAAQKKEAADARAAKKAATADTKKSPAKKPSAKKATTTGAKKTPAKKSAAKKATNKTARKATPASKSAKKSEAAKSRPTQSTAGKKAVAAPPAAKPKQRIRIATEAASPPGATANTESGQQRVRIASPRIRIANPNDAAERDAEALREAQAEQEADAALAGGKKRAPKALAKPQSTARTAPEEKQEPAAKKSPTRAAPAEQKAPATKKPPAKQPAQVQPPPPAQTKTAPKKVPPPAPVSAAKKASPAPQPPPTQTAPPPQTLPAKPQQKKTPAPGKPPGPGSKGLNITGTAQTKTFFNDQVQVSVQEKVGAAKPFHVTTAITLSGGGSIGGQASRGSSGASGNLSASGSLSISYSKWMTEQEKNQYLASVATGHGAGHAESTIIELIASNQQDAAGEAIKKAKARMGDRQQGEAGDTEEISVEGDVSAGAGGSRGPVGGNVEISSGKGIRRTRTLMEDGRELYTVTVTLRSGQSIGGTVQSGVASGGYNDARDETRTVYYSFLLNPDAGDYSARKNEILAATSVEELKGLAQKHRDLAYGSGQSQAKSNVGTTSAGVLGFGIDIDQSSFYEEGEGQDPSGKQRHVRGGAGIGGSVTFLGRRLNPSSKTDSFSGWVDENNVGGGVTQSENREVDLQKTAAGLADAASHPVASAVAIAKGKPILQERVDSVGVNLSDDSFSRIAELAKDEKAWFRAWTGKGVSRGSKDDWEAARQQVLAANGDRYKIQQAMAKWEKGDSGRSAEVENLTGGTGVSFDFPDEILDQKPVYDQLVMGDLLAGPRQLVAEGKTSEAVSQLEGLNRRLGQLLQTVQMHSGKSTDPGKFAEVQSRIAARQKQLRQEIYRLTSPSSKAATKAGEPPPEPVAAPPPDFVGPLSVDQQEAVKAERKEASETIHTQVGVCLVNRDVENKAFAEVVDELDDFYIDRAFIFNKLNSLKPMYTKWDAAIAELKAAYPKIGDPPDRANQFAPNRDRWNALNNQALK